VHAYCLACCLLWPLPVAVMVVRPATRMAGRRLCAPGASLASTAKGPLTPMALDSNESCRLDCGNGQWAVGSGEALVRRLQGWALWCEWWGDTVLRCAGDMRQFDPSWQGLLYHNQLLHWSTDLDMGLTLIRQYKSYAHCGSTSSVFPTGSLVHPWSLHA
jgi:hypothetical protein